MAGTACGDTYGVSTNCELCSVKALDNSGTGTWSGVVAAVNHVVSKCPAGNGTRCVANMSLGGPGNSASLTTAVTNAVDEGIVVTVAAGNNNDDACGYTPAGIGPAVTVGSTTSGDQRSSFSSYGTCVDVSAPGTNIVSTANTGESATMSGTSMASPRENFIFFVRIPDCDTS